MKFFCLKVWAKNVGVHLYMAKHGTSVKRPRLE